ncbi:MAG TPA: hypothetical protein PLF13_06655 [candidate division Zixibacteria bacterium]|mgnify:FL=1|nr:hypothetical protein [candidate division Zixibacteria bacterium]
MDKRTKVLIAAIVIMAPLLLTVSDSRAGDPDLLWAPTKIKIDGNTSDWSDVPMTYYKDEEVSVGMTNDSNRLYILVRTGKQEVAGFMSMSGLNVYLNGQGKKKKDFKLCVKGGMRPQMMGGPNEGFRGGMDRKVDDRGSAKMQFTCYIKDRVEEKEIPVDGGEGPAVAIDTSHGLIAYEFSIPIKEADVRDYGLGGTLGDKFAVGLMWGDVEQGSGPGGGGPGGGSGGGMGGGPPGGGSGGGMGGGPPGGGSGGGMGGGPGGGGPGGGGGREMPEKQELWLKAKLAVPAVEQANPNEG